MQCPSNTPNLSYYSNFQIYSLPIYHLHFITIDHDKTDYWRKLEEKERGSESYVVKSLKLYVSSLQEWFPVQL